MKDKDLKRRINGARETVKITHAMQLVSASKMTKAEKKLQKARDFLLDMKEIVSRIGKTESALLTPKAEVRHITYIVIASDKGLCGDYNHKILDYAMECIEKDGKENTVYPIGQFSREFFFKAACKVKAKYVHLLQGAASEEMRAFSEDLAEDFLSGKTDEVRLIYTDVSETVARQKAKLSVLLPLSVERKEESSLEYRNDADRIIKQYIWSRIYFAVCSGDYAFNYKCMVAMQKATKSGENLVGELKKEFNHLRQEKITSELMDSFSPSEDEK